MSAITGRGAISNPAGRFETTEVEPTAEAGEPEVPVTVTRAERVGKIISHNKSPDIPFDRSINPYRGCEHGCIYCYARPTHAWLNLSPGLDFETRLFYKENAVSALEKELSSPAYRCKPITIGANTDPYQPIEKRLRLTRQILAVLQRYNHPVTLVTKGSAVEADLDILAPMARDGLAAVMLSVTTLDDALKRIMEPRAAAPRRRLETIARLSAAGVPAGVLVAPVIPTINDGEIEAIVAAAAAAGATRAGFTVLRLPHELKTLFREWLATHYPDRAAHVMSVLRQMHGGRDYDARFGVRQRGRGPFADLIAARFRGACRQAGIDNRSRLPLDTSRFAVPEQPGQQLSLLG